MQCVVYRVVAVLPLAVYLLHRLLRAALSIERYTGEALTAGLGIARNTGAVKALDDTVALGGELGAVAVRKMDGIQETTQFPLPKGLRLDGPAAAQD